LEPEVEFRRQKARFEFRFGGIALPLIKIFSGNLVGMQVMECSKYVFFENPIWETVAIYQTYNITFSIVN